MFLVLWALFFVSLCFGATSPSSCVQFVTCDACVGKLDLGSNFACIWCVNSSSALSYGCRSSVECLGIVGGMSLNNCPADPEQCTSASSCSECRSRAYDYGSPCVWCQSPNSSRSLGCHPRSSSCAVVRPCLTQLEVIAVALVAWCVGGLIVGVSVGCGVLAYLINKSKLEKQHALSSSSSSSLIDELEYLKRARQTLAALALYFASFVLWGCNVFSVGLSWSVAASFEKSKIPLFVVVVAGSLEALGVAIVFLTGLGYDVSGLLYGSVSSPPALLWLSVPSLFGLVLVLGTIRLVATTYAGWSLPILQNLIPQQDNPSPPVSVSSPSPPPSASSSLLPTPVRQPFRPQTVAFSPPPSLEHGPFEK